MTSVVAILFAILLISLLQVVFYASRATMHRKPGVPYWPGNLESPNNILFRPHQLTEVGLRARRLCFIWLGVFLGTLLGSIVLAIIYEKFFK
jgi:hypothetical protein